jgi:hypothetical protein
MADWFSVFSCLESRPAKGRGARIFGFRLVKRASTSSLRGGYAAVRRAVRPCAFCGAVTVLLQIASFNRVFAAPASGNEFIVLWP